MNNSTARFRNNLLALPLLALTGAFGCAHAQAPDTSATAPAPTPAATSAPAAPTAASEATEGVPSAADAMPANTKKTAKAPAWQNTGVIYCAYPQIFSKNGLNGVTAQLPRLKSLGVTIIWLMPFQPLGQNITIGGVARTTLTPPTPYDQADPAGIDPAEGTAADLTKLLASAHAAGMHVILDVCINQTAWNDPLLSTHPEYYYHTDNNPKNVNSIDVGFPNAFRDGDIAGVDLRTDQYGAQTYMKGVLKHWLTDFKFDGFRVDSADSPKGDTRDLVQPYAQNLYASLGPVGKYMWLEEGESPVLADAPYTIDYDWNVAFYSQYGDNGNFLLQDVAKNGNNVSTLETTVVDDAPGGPGSGGGSFPAGFQHMNILMDWDTAQDYSLCGGYPQVLDAAAFNLTIPGVPLIYNGEEVGNDKGTDHLNHDPIDWHSPNAAKFQSFYKTMLALRRANPALRQGTLNFTSNSNKSASVATFQRVSGSNECYVEVNFSGQPQSGTLTAPGGTGAWTDVSPAVSPGRTAHALPSTGKFKLAAYDYAVFRRTASGIPATAPASDLTAASTTTTTAAGSKNLAVTLTHIGSPTTFDLTAAGTTDWAAWGLDSDTSFNHKASGGAKISDVTPAGGSLHSFESKYVAFTWTDGAPDATATAETKGYYNQGGVGDGFTLTAPADTTPRILTVYVGGYDSAGTLTAALSDNSSPAYTDSSLTGPGTSYYGAYTLTYKAATPGQKLTLTWKQSKPGTNVTLYAATLK